MQGINPHQTGDRIAAQPVFTAHLVRRERFAAGLFQFLQFSDDVVSLPLREHLIPPQGNDCRLFADVEVIESSLHEVGFNDIHFRFFF